MFPDQCWRYFSSRRPDLDQKREKPVKLLNSRWINLMLFYVSDSDQHVWLPVCGSCWRITQVCFNISLNSSIKHSQTLLFLLCRLIYHVNKKRKKYSELKTLIWILHYYCLTKKLNYLKMFSFGFLFLWFLSCWLQLVVFVFIHYFLTQLIHFSLKVFSMSKTET